MKLIIQIPCYNEAETLEIALHDLPRHIDGIDEIEYLIINDGSDDDTERIALEWGVHYVVHFKRNLGLAKGFLAGIDLALRNGADIIVNTDADNQYSGADIGKLVQPILEKKADIVIGERPIDEIEEFSWIKKKLQRLGPRRISPMRPAAFAPTARRRRCASTCTMSIHIHWKPSCRRAETRWRSPRCLYIRILSCANQG